MNDWISVKDRLPESGTGVLVCQADDITIAYISRDGTWNYQDRRGTINEKYHKVTHWMPKPELPDDRE